MKKNIVRYLDYCLVSGPVLNILLGFFLVVVALGCNPEKVPDCFQGAGEISREEISVPAFSKITVFEHVELILSYGTTQRVEVETGKNLRAEVNLEVIGDRLLIKDENNCNLFRNYGLTKVFISAPNITEIRSSTGFPIRSLGILPYNSLVLYAESFTDPEAETTDGSFDLELDSDNVRVVVNGIAYVKLSGNTADLNITIAAGDSRVEAQNLVADIVSLNHRGSNDIIVNPQSLLQGVIRGTGDVISVNNPDVIDIEVLYKGQLILQQ